VKEITYQGYKVHVTMGAYANGRPAILLQDYKTFDQLAVGSVNLPDFNIDNDSVAIKNYSENIGMLDFLIDYGVIEEPFMYIEQGWAKFPVCKLKPRYYELYTLNEKSLRRTSE